MTVHQFCNQHTAKVSQSNITTTTEKVSFIAYALLGMATIQFPSYSPSLRVFMTVHKLNQSTKAKFCSIACTTKPLHYVSRVTRCRRTLPAETTWRGKLSGGRNLLSLPATAVVSQTLCETAADAFAWLRR